MSFFFSKVTRCAVSLLGVANDLHERESKQLRREFQAGAAGRVGIDLQSNEIGGAIKD